MRRLSARRNRPAQRRNGERGAISILVALLMVVLLGFVAIVVDVGLLYAERAQLRNGADAAALGMAQTCARNTSDPLCSDSSVLAKQLADSNAADGLSNVRAITLNKAAGAVTVSTGAQSAGGEPDTVSFFFAGILGIPTAEAGAESSAVWGSPTAGTTPFPVAFSVCQVEGKVEGGAQRLQLHGSGANPACNYGPSGAPVPGGFGWLVQDPGVCGGSVDITVNEGGSAPGNSGPPNCEATLNRWAAELTAGRKVTVLLPVFDKVTGTGASASYHLKAFAAFSISGWKFTGGDTLPMTFRSTSSNPQLDCSQNCRGIIGSFVKYVSLADGYRLGPVDAYGARVVRLTL